MPGTLERIEVWDFLFFFTPVTLQLSHNWPVKCAFLSGIVCFMICR